MEHARWSTPSRHANFQTDLVRYQKRLKEKGETMKAKNRPGKRTADVFSDLGFAPAEAENQRIRSAMMRTLVAFVRKRLTQERAARLLGVTQPRVSDLMRGKIHLFSIDNLVNLLSAAGLRVDLRVKKEA
jgi:predicted XRE-type DNA-binding protein